MKKFFLLLTMSISLYGIAQVGINTTAPKGTLEVSRNMDLAADKPQGVIFPKFSTEERSQFVGTAVGTMIYNTDHQCIEVYKGSGLADGWQCLYDVGKRITVTPSDFEGFYVGGSPFIDGNKVKFTLENKGLDAITNVNFSDAVSLENPGGNVSVKAGQYTSVSLNGGESKTLAYILEGTPSTGTLTATFNKFELQANQTQPVVGNNVVIRNKDHYLLSVEHNDITIQEKINNGDKKVTIKIPYINGYGNYAAVNITQTSAPGQGGDTNPLTLKIAPNTFSEKGDLTATIEVGGDGEYLVKQMTPGTTYDIATFNVNMNGSTFQVVLKGTGGVLDKKYGDGDGTHKFLYVPVGVTTAEGYNKTWLTMNLGAEAAKVGSSEFDPTLKKYSEDAHEKESLYGSLYQWQRPSDGHEFRNSLTTSTLADNWQATSPPSIIGKFIKTYRDINWVTNGENASGENLQLWQAGKPNNPCPTGYHVPTKAEWEDLKNALSTENTVFYYQTLIPNFTTSGSHSNEEDTVSPWYGYYWSSDSSGSQRAFNLFFNGRGDSGDEIESNSRSVGMSVRCIKD